ncbi:MAG: sulfatase-like hydrolase/transferase, partial [Bacteroidetes bacterium]|nr:sulfatase-like hydrolase/transferase [Bacteroidota bacterium]
EVLNLQLKELGAAKKPFFSVLSTLTSHEWFDADVPHIFHNDPDHVNDDYRNTVHYADSCVFAWFNNAKKQPWYANTIMVLVADHACNFPRHRDLQDTGRFQIPMLITGGALKPEWRGRKISVPGSQVDIAATLLAQMGLKEPAFEYSKNLLNPAGAHFAWYAFDHGFGYISPAGAVVYDHNSSKVRSTCVQPTVTARQLKQGKCYLQKVANTLLPGQIKQ